MPYRLAFATAVLFAVTVLAQSDSGLNEVKDKVAKGQARLIDVREEAEWKEGHLKNATLVPLTQIAKGQIGRAHV